MPERKCVECGASLFQDSIFCHVCGTKREICTCGAFLDAGMRYCAKCGKPTDEGLVWKEENDKLNKKIAELNKEFEKIEEEENKVAEEEKKVEGEEKEVKEEEEKIRKENEERRLKVEELARQLGIRTGMTEEELKYSSIDKDGYIELSYPIGNIHMIEKSYNKFNSFEEAQKYAQELTLGGFKDWRIPTFEELEIIYKIRNLCRINIYYGAIYFSSTIIHDRTSSYYYCGLGSYRDPQHTLCLLRGKEYRGSDYYNSRLICIR